MTECTYCRAIDISKLTPFPGFSRNFSFTDLDGVPSQLHHPSLKSLRASAPSCPGCALFLDGLTAGQRRGKTAGVLLKHVGADDFADELWDPSLEEKPVVLRGLGREGFTGERKQLYGTILSTTTILPTRVLDLEVGKEQQQQQQVCLVLGKGQTGRYVALSHCWGSGRVVRTTKETFAEFTRGIDVAGLNKTFRDAIMVTRRLGLRYLWIDSLCIVQDDAVDWERESARMAQIYSQAHLTIAASAATDGSEGLLRSEPQFSRLRLSDDDDDDDDEKVLNRGCSIGPYLLRFRRLIAAPLNTRAWTLQERILSSRIVHFARDQVHWECRESIVSEAGGPPYGELLDNSGEESFHRGWLGRVSEDLLPKSEAERLELEAERADNGRSEYETWYGVIQVYSQRGLTKEEDKLPALSGIAHAYSLRHESEYIAGLWMGGLATGLLWYNATTDPLRRPKSYRAPSWSWASVEGPVDFFSISAGTILENTVEIYDAVARIEPDGLDPFGRVKYGELSLWGAIKRANLKTIREKDGFEGEVLSTQMIFDEISALGSATLDIPVPDGEVTCLLISSGYDSFGMNRRNNIVLILKPTGRKEKKNEFTRLGMSIFYEARNYTPGQTIRLTNPPTLHSDEDGPGYNPETDDLEDWFFDVDLTEITIV
ncbi:heterokaryon incompatibility protein-domain-containing protein [Poronia punctata]|nr:heterokaryon incompatibility protein-domain-containing protein [Poronia punctata]